MAAPNGDKSPTCPSCLRTFSSYQGRRVHERSQHPLHFHETEVAALLTVKKVRWDPEELAMMAAFEARNLRAKYINVKIQAEVLPHRSIESIKGARKAEAYKALVRQNALSPREAPRSPPLPAPSITPEGPPVPIITLIGSPVIPITPWSTASGGPQPPPPHLKSEEDVHAGRVGLEVGHNKCATINIVGDGKRKRWLVGPSIFCAGGVELRALGPGETYKYLGLEVGPAMGHAEPGWALAALVRDLGALQKAPLKPQQKLWAVYKVIMPKHLYARILGTSTKSTLRRFDNEVKKFVRKAFHLPKDTPNVALHAKTGHGGLGVPTFLSRVPAQKRGCLERLSNSTNARVAMIAGALLGNPPCPSAKEQLKDHSNTMRDALYATADGRGLSGTDRSPPTHDWVGDGTLLMRGSSYINALKTRLGVVNTRLRSSRGRPAAPVQCDLGCGRPESLGHILQSCPKLAPERTRRHDRVLDLLHQQLCRKNWQLLREPHIRTQAGVRVPDLVIWDRQGSTVLDVQVVADNSVSDFLSRAHDLKRFYYDVGDVRAWVRDKTGHPPRGTMATPSYMALRSMRLTKAELRLLVVRAMEGSVVALRTHRDMGGHG
ncbi:Retrovirus-related Pol polyprotein from type-1 retrotransposable element R2 [Portunus trituberculatus]|uniref:Retrovirus-related Pol polyprotein from type-1 retrotransposable element R2 n=1 Tax=Portunus trituberculatus TaxID=210409 RepID=A0A5B7FXB6_PORTR|nr:Retrovirus-related Pol polyprotein from type-1 retrotransposable element R2 [Portunus trituberculatus]